MHKAAKAKGRGGGGGGLVGGRHRRNLLPEIKVPLCSTRTSVSDSDSLEEQLRGRRAKDGNGSARIMEKRNRVKFALYRGGDK